MPRTWHDRHAVNKIEDEKERELYRSIVADKKPYFMRYIYPALMKQYNTYIKNTDKNAMREFKMSIKELLEIPNDELTERQREFLKYYDYRMPVGTGDCIMNIICKKIEKEFDGYVGRFSASSNFDYSVMKSGSDYTQSQYLAIKRLYEDYNRRIKSYAIFADYERISEYDTFTTISELNDEFRKECAKICPDRFVLCDIILDICYTKSSTKRFAWSMCGNEIIANLLKRNDNRIIYPTKDENGDIYYCGERFSLTEIELEECE